MAHFELLTNTNLNVLGRKGLFLGVSILALAFSLGVIFTRGLNYGIDFRGGTEVRVKFVEEPDIASIRRNLESLDLGSVNIQRLGRLEERELLIRVGEKSGLGEEGGMVGAGDVSQTVLSSIRLETDAEQEAAGKLDLNQVDPETLGNWLATQVEAAKLSGEMPPDSAPDPRKAVQALVEARNNHHGIFRSMDDLDGIAEVTPEIRGLLDQGAFLGSLTPRSLDFVGPTAGKELIQKAQYAVIGSIIGILIYVGFRFRPSWGLAGVVALVHDVVIAMGALALTQKEFSLPVVAALLTIAGYSINDTVVVFDRIRENLRLYRAKNYELVVNASINQTFSRTILTSFTALLAAISLYLFGGDKLDALAFTLLVGFVSGTYSSIFVASPLLVMSQNWLGARKAKA